MGGGKGSSTPAPEPVVPEMPVFEMPVFHMPQEPETTEDTGPTYEEQQAELARQEGIQQRDQLYSDYMNAAGAATDYVNTEISDEMSNARLLGIDYEITDEMKQKRINDYFASIWGEGQQAQLEALMNQWGNPAGFTEFVVTRGDETVYGAVEPGGEEIVGTTGNRPVPTLVTEEEEELGRAGTILGSA